MPSQRRHSTKIDLPKGTSSARKNRYHSAFPYNFNRTGRKLRSWECLPTRAVPSTAWRNRGWWDTTADLLQADRLLAAIITITFIDSKGLTFRVFSDLERNSFQLLRKASSRSSYSSTYEFMRLLPHLMLTPSLLLLTYWFSYYSMFP